MHRICYLTRNAYISVVQILFYLVLICGLVSPAMAEPTSERIRIVKVRPYHEKTGVPAWVYVTFDRVPFCDSTTFVIPMSWGGAKETYAIALAALLSNREVLVEMDNAGCASPNWTTKIQSLYLLN